jgi:hypothetical protein
VKQAATDLPTILLVVVGIAFATQALAQEERVISFGTTRLGELPEGFHAARTGRGAPASWTVLEDASAPAGRVFAQTSTDQTDYRFPLAVYDGVTASDVEVTVGFKAVAGRVDRAGGIAVRFAGPDDYYVLRANALEDNVNFYRVVHGSRRQIHGVNAKVTSGQWHTLSLRSVGDQFTIGFDGATLFTTTDRTFPGPGKVALWTKADSITYFDSLTIRPRQ